MAKSKKTKAYLLYSLLVVLTLCVVVGIFIYTKNVKMAEGTDSFNMYYINYASNTLEIEKRAINSVSDTGIMFNSVVEEYFAGSKNANLGLSLPKEFKVIDKRYSGNTAYINLSSSFNSLTPDKRMLSMGSLVYTLTDLDFINNVCVSVEGVPMLDKQTQEIAVFNRDIVSNNPTISPEKTNWQTVKLYFADSSGKYLVMQQRGIEVKQSQSLEYQIVEQLIAGPDREKNSNLLKTLPSDTKIKDIKTEEGTCYVNLSREFIKKKEGLSEPIIIYSIVNSLTELEGVKKVQFLIDGEKINEYNGDMDFGKPFDRNVKLIKEIE